MSDKPKILVVAYSASENLGSEGSAGASWIKALSSLAEVTVVTREKNVEGLRLSENEVGLVGYDLPKFVRRLKGSLLPLSIYYHLWMVFLPAHLRRTIDLKQYDYAWHLTFATVHRRSAAFKLGLPVIWGPVGGRTVFRRKLLLGLGAKGALKEVARFGLERVLEPSARKRASAAHLVIYQNPETVLDVRATNYVVRTNIVLDRWRQRNPEGLASVEMSPTFRPRILFVSRSELKGERLLEKFILDSAPNAKFTVIGSVNPRRWREVGLADVVQVVDWLPRDSYMDLLLRHDGFLSLSTRESAGWAIAESLREGTPVFAFDINGPAGIRQQGGGELQGLTLCKPDNDWHRHLGDWLDGLMLTDTRGTVDVGSNFSALSLQRWLEAQLLKSPGPVF